MSRDGLVSIGTIDAAIARGPAATIDEVSNSGLRGRGGAGFATGTEWAACRAVSGEHRYVVRRDSRPSA